MPEFFASYSDALLLTLLILGFVIGLSLGYIAWGVNQTRLATLESECQTFLSEINRTKADNDSLRHRLN